MVKLVKLVATLSFVSWHCVQNSSSPKWLHSCGVPGEPRRMCPHNTEIRSRNSPNSPFTPPPTSSAYSLIIKTIVSHHHHLISAAGSEIGPLKCQLLQCLAAHNVQKLHYTEHLCSKTHTHCFNATMLYIFTVIKLYTCSTSTDTGTGTGKRPKSKDVWVQ